MTGKTAVILFNLGGPDKPESIRPFLLNFFMDKNIIRAPWFVRCFLARLIANRRSKNEAGSAYSKLGGKSPLLENTMQQAGALQGELGPDYRVFVTMRYWHPLAKETVKLVKDYDPDRVLLLPLYPQYSTTTTRSSVQDWQAAAHKENLGAPTSLVCCYPTNEGFIRASAEKIAEAYKSVEQTIHRKPRILFSAHGLPEKIIKDGDPYQWQCEESARKIAEILNRTHGLFDLDWTVCYQSRVGPLKWIGPSTEDAIRVAAKDKVPIIIYPHAFVNEHVETLVEIGEEYRDLAKDMGVPVFSRVDTVGTHPEFIRGLADLVRSSSSRQKCCPAKFSRCCRNEFDISKI